MDNLDLLGKSLIEWSRNSSTEFLEGEEFTKELVKLVKDRGIQYPNRNLAFFKTRYAEVDVPNRNKVVLPKIVAEKGLPSMAGCQINFNHTGKGNICGFILDAKLEKNMVVAYGCLWKDMFKDEFANVKKMFDEKKLFVSFEIHRFNSEGKDITSPMKDGTLRVNDIYYSGMGLLTSESPACPKARVLNLLASEKALGNEVITAPDDALREDTIYAEMFIEKPICKNCTTCTCEKGDKKMDEVIVEQGASLADDTNEAKVDAKKKTCATCNKELDEKEMADDVCAICKNKKVKAELETVEAVVETVITVEQTVKETQTVSVDDNGVRTNAIETEVITNKEISLPDGTKETVEDKTVSTHVYTVEEMIDDMEASLEGAIPKEVSVMIKKLLKDGKSFKEAAKIAWDEYKKSNDTKKASLEEEHKIVLEAKDKEIEVLKQELATQKQEIDTIKAEEEKVPETKAKLVSGVKDTELDKEDKSSMKTVGDYYFRQKLDK